MSGSIAVHVVALIAVFAIALPRETIRDRQESSTPSPPMVWVAIAGPGGGGGRAANIPAPPQPAPPPPPAAALAPPPIPAPTPVVDDVPQPLGVESPVPFDVASASSLGAIGPPSAPRGDGRGDGSGDGDGKGDGDGTIDGSRGVFEVGNGVTPPFPLTRASGKYTPEAVLARAQGTISVECVVQTDGQCGDVRIVRAFNPSFGLHTEALNAARRWRFRPGMRNNMPVPVLIRLDIEFRIH